MSYKKEFPIFDYHPNLVYLDSAATCQKPKVVIDAIYEYNIKYNASPNRGSYSLSVEATKIYNNAKDRVAKFINGKREEIIFTKSATEAFNLVASTYSNFLNKGDTILIGITSHHSNIIPWQEIKNKKGINLEYIYLDESSEFDSNDLESKLKENVKIVTFSHGVNATGILHNVENIVKKVREKTSAIVILDICQSIAHKKIDVKDLDVDIAVYSAHKIFGPIGIGVLYMREELIEKLPPFLFGGDMIEFVEEQESTFKRDYEKFEGGTQNVEGAVGLDKALEFVDGIGLENIAKIEGELLKYAIKKLGELDFVTLYHYKNIEKTPVIAFNINGVHPHDVSQVADFHNVAIRTGHHCAQPLMKYMGIFGCCRASFSIFNTKEDIDKLVEALVKVADIFS